MAKLYAVSFSPTGSSKRVCESVVEGVNGKLGMEVCAVDLTKVEGRQAFGLKCEPDDVLVLTFPVYTGRVPLTLREAIDGIDGNGARAVLVATYGNREFDDALREAVDFVGDRGFKAVAACAFVAEHSFSRAVAAGRPDADDLAVALEYGTKIGDKLSAASEAGYLEVPGNFPYVDYNGVMPFRPKTNEACVECGVCVDVCPTDNIDAAAGFAAGDACIQCFACIKACDVQAKFFDDAPLMGIIGFLEGNCTARKEPQLFL